MKSEAQIRAELARLERIAGRSFPMVATVQTDKEWPSTKAKATREVELLRWVLDEPSWRRPLE